MSEKFSQNNNNNSKSNTDQQFDLKSAKNSSALFEISCSYSTHQVESMNAAACKPNRPRLLENDLVQYSGTSQHNLLVAFQFIQHWIKFSLRS